MPQNLPNFLVIGAPRSGTTWLYQNLKTHPDVFLSETKELHFFDRNYEKGMEFYKKNFEGSETYKAVGEMTPQYLFSKEVAARIKENIPNAKLIVLLRNPTDRLYSSYQNYKSKNKELTNLSFEKDLESRPHLLEEGLYAVGLTTYFDLFDKANVFVGFYEEVEKDPVALWKRLCNFLNIDQNFISPYISNKINTAASKKYLANNKLYYYFSKVFRRLGLKSLAFYFEKKNFKDYDPMNEKTRKWLVEEVYYKSNKQLENLLNINLSHWNK